MKPDPTSRTENSIPLHHALGRAKGQVISRSRQTLSTWAYRGWLPKKLSARLIEHFWDSSAGDINERYGHERGDYALLEAIITRYRIRSILDAGCGSGRLFGLYEQCGVTRIVGTDISGRANFCSCGILQAELRLVRLEDLDEPPGSFDLGVCNRVLQHIPERDIERVVANLCRACRAIYVNELTKSDEQDEAFFMRRHNYPNLFIAQGRTIIERGTIGLQTYMVFGSLAEQLHSVSPDEFA